MKDKLIEFLSDDLEFKSLIKKGKMCPICYEFNIVKKHSEDNFISPECYYDECLDCGHQWNIE
jgi:Zn ribbon nucleic-acid-binding protein